MMNQGLVGSLWQTTISFKESKKIFVLTGLWWSVDCMKWSRKCSNLWLMRLWETD
jgi:hypothetical protein